MIDLPQDWTPRAQMERIHVHWTAGGHRANETDRSHYHILVEGDGNLVRGDRSIAANARGSGLPRASHTLNANTGAIGISMCAMRRSREFPFDAGPAALTEAQWRRMCEVAATLARRYAIPVTRTTLLTHAEVEQNLGIPQRQKWDVTRLPFDAALQGARAVGDRMRRDVAILLDGGTLGTSGGAAEGVGEADPNGPRTNGARTNGSGAGRAAARAVATLPPELRLPRFRVMGVAPSTLNFRRGPGGEVVGALPEGVTVEKLSAAGDWWHVRTPGGFSGWVSADFLRAAH